MRILQINTVYKQGSTGKIVFAIHSGIIDSGNQSFVIYGRGQKTPDSFCFKSCNELAAKVHKLFSFIIGNQYGGLLIPTKKIISIINRINPDIIHIHCLNGDFVNIYNLLNFLKKKNINTILTLHAEFMYTANCGYAFDCNQWKTGCKRCNSIRRSTRSLLFNYTKQSWKRMKKAFDGFDNLFVVSVSDWLMKRAIQSPMLKNKKHTVIMNGLDTSIFKYYDINDVGSKLNLDNRLVFFHATPCFNNDPNHIKGGYYLIELAKRLENIVFLVAGSYSDNLKVPPNIILLGNITSQTELAKYYSLADITILTSKKETFSMVVAESLCCGTPVVGFLSGAPETIAIPQYSAFVEHGNIDAMIHSCHRILDSNFDKNTVSKIAHDKYSQSNMVARYLELYEKEVKL